ncbi:sugar isomerase domain-containing protein, partial [Enterococcus faecium]
SGRNPIIIDLALAAKAKGVKIISLTNVQYSRSVTSRHSSGKRLFEVSDIVIDNHGDIGDACCELTGIVQKAGPSSTVIGAAILNTIIVEVCEQLIANGIKHPPIFYSANLDGGDLRNAELYEEYKEVIHYEFM